MAEYYPLLARAIAGLPQSTPEARRNIYDRARAALIGQLRAVQPPIAPEDIERESRMLDEAIDRLEMEATAAADEANAPAVEAPSAKPSDELPPAQAAQASDLSAREGPTSPPPVSGPPVSPPSSGPASDAPSSARPVASARPGIPPRPGLPPRPVLPAPPSTIGSGRSGLGALEAARQRLAGLARPASQRLGMPSAPMPGARPDTSATPPIAITVPVPGAPAPEVAADARTGVTLRKYGPRAEAAGVSADFPPSEPTESAEGVRQEDDDNSAQRGIRPAAPLPPEEKERNFRALLIGVPVAAVVATIAVFAYLNRDTPEDLVRLRPAPGAEAPAEPGAGKIVERVGGGQAARTGAAPGTAASNAQQQGQASTSNAPAIPVSQRAALLIDAPDEPQRVKTFVGNVVWRLDNVSRGPGQPLAIGVRAEIDLPDARLRAVMLLQKNTDETLPASHTIEVRFVPAEGGPVPGIAQISTPQMRKEDTPAGDALTGVPAPIMRNFFLVGLTRGDAAAARNVDLIRTRGWFDLPMLMSDQRIAKLTFEKGAAGERIINEAFEAWK